MISERKFVSSHSSFWRAVLPLGDAFTRTVNRNLRLFAGPYPSLFPSSRNAAISELGFRIFSGVSHAILSGVPEEAVDAPLVISLADQTRDYIESLEGALPARTITREERREALELARRLARFFAHNESGRMLITRPSFAGCGILHDTEGDVLAGTVLYEIKNVDRDFRLVDLRQLLTYAALNSAAPAYEIDGVALLNVRSGKYFRIGLNNLSLAVAGFPAAKLLSEVINYLSAETTYMTADRTPI
jgi:hypothetical protein